ncbi:MAG: CoA transferase [Epsilonproteobacteria bacterium]|nr:CoA transferase [Campylobacterota bacterium]
MNWREWAKANDAARDNKPEALSGLFVLDMSYANLSGSFAASLLAEYGATVLRIEPPSGDPARNFTPDGITADGVGLSYLSESRNKHSIRLNLSFQPDIDYLKSLMIQADIVIETNKPGWLYKKGISYFQVKQNNKKLIWCSIYTYGQYGPLAACDQEDSDITDQAISGIMYITGEMEDKDDPKIYQVPTRFGNHMAWYAGGAWASFGIMTALYYRNKTGAGQMIDISPAEGFGKLSNSSISYNFCTGETLERLGKYDAAVFPYSYFPTKDCTAFIAAYSDVNWKKLCWIMKRDDLAGKSTHYRLQPENMQTLWQQIAEWTRKKTYREMLNEIETASKKGIAGTIVIGKILTPMETFNDSNWRIRDIFKQVSLSDGSILVLANQGVHATETPPRIKWVETR